MEKRAKSANKNKITVLKEHEMKNLSIEYLNTADLIPYENNPRNNDEAVQYVANSIQEFGFKVPIIIDRNNVIVAGHTRLKAALQLGLEEVPCVRADDLTDDQVKALRLIDNKVAEYATWDSDKLEQEINEIGMSLLEFGFDTINQEEIVIDEDGFDFEPQEPEPAISQRGEIYQLGEHRLMVGDSTRPEDMDTLMGEETADLLVTDPPYNVSLGMNAGHAIRPSEAKQLHRRTDGLVIENDEMDEENFIVFLTQAFTTMLDQIKEGTPFYIFYASTQTKNFLIAAENAEMEIRQILVWVKDIFALGRQDYQWRHEPILYGWKGTGHYFTYERNITTVFEEIPKDFDELTKEEAIKLLKKIADLPADVIREDKPRRSELHPTMKPIGLLAKLINNSSHKGDIVLDPFGGSGSTMIACEQLGRKCRMMEIDPHYADVIVKRWEDFTGQKAVKIRG